MVIVFNSYIFIINGIILVGLEFYFIDFELLMFIIDEVIMVLEMSGVLVLLLIYLSYEGVIIEFVIIVNYC